MKKPITATVRPAIPLALCLFATLWAGVWFAQNQHLGTALGADQSSLTLNMGQRILVVTGFALATLVVSRLAEMTRLKVALVVLAVLITGLAAGHVRVDELVSDRQWVIEHGKAATIQPIRVQAIQDPRHGKFGWSGEIAVEINGRAIKAQLNYPKNSSVLLLGQTAFIKLTLTPLEFNQPNRRQLNQGVVAQAKLTGLVRPFWATSLTSALFRWRAQQSERIAGDGLAIPLVRGLLLGDRTSDVNGELGNLFARCGLSHIMSVSGTHLALVAGLILATVGLCVGSRHAYIIAAVVTLGYVVLTGMAPATWRSWGMFLSLSVAVFLYRRPHALHALGITGLVSLLVEPLLVFDVGFQMSVIAVLAIVIYTPLMQMWIRALVPRLPLWLTSSLSVAVIATAATIPISASVFGEVSRIGVFCNLIFVPLLSALLVVGCGAMLVATVSPPISAAVYKPLVWMSSLIISGIERAGRSPTALMALTPGVWIWLMILALAVGIYVIWPTFGTGIAEQKTRMNRVRFGMAFITVCAIGLLTGKGLINKPAPPEHCRVAMLDVGQGDATLIKTPDTTLLIDAGPSTQSLMSALKEQGVRTIDTVIFTHDHADHVDGADALRSFDVDTIFVAEGTDQSSVYRNISTNLKAAIRTIKRGMVIADKYVEIQVLWPRSIPEDPDENEQSLIMLITWAVPRGQAQRSALISGDAEADAIHSALSSTSTANIGIIKVAHHGSKDAVDNRLLETYGPQHAVISCGEDNSYGHPAQETLALLRNHQVSVWRTDIQGTYVVGQ